MILDLLLGVIATILHCLAAMFHISCFDCFADVANSRCVYRAYLARVRSHAVSACLCVAAMHICCPLIASKLTLSAVQSKQLQPRHETQDEVGDDDGDGDDNHGDAAGDDSTDHSVHHSFNHSVRHPVDHTVCARSWGHVPLVILAVIEKKRKFK